MQSSEDHQFPPDIDADHIRDDDAFSLDEIEQAYQRALEISENAEHDFPELKHLEAFPNEAHALEQQPTENAPVRRVVASKEALIQARHPQESIDQPQLSLPQIVEAYLFVGGEGLTLKRLSTFLNQEGKPEVIEAAICELNELYELQQRPYRIDLQEGGYHLKLIYEYEPIRHRVFGLAPKEVKLSQDVIEVLAYIAYQQPVKLEQLKTLENESLASCLRQLTARDLVAITKAEDDQDRYVTTSRFLQVFGISALKDLPRPDSLDYK